MPTIALSLPIAPGETETFRDAYQRFAVNRRAEFEESRRRLGVRSERGFLQRGPSGDVAIVIFEVDDPARMFAGVAASHATLDAEFRSYLRRVFGIDATQPPPAPPPQLVFDWRAE